MSRSILVEVSGFQPVVEYWHLEVPDDVTVGPEVDSNTLYGLLSQAPVRITDVTVEWIGEVERRVALGVRELGWQTEEDDERDDR